jgi:DNA-binding GntR family transcriptional regulator
MTVPADLPSIEGSSNLPDQLAAVLTRAIIDGRFKPGDHIQADEIAAHFSVSKIPVREALRSLEADGWIVIRPRRGAFVQEHSSAELISLHEMRGMVEPSLAGLAAQRRSPTQLERLREIVARGHDIARAGTPADVAFNNREFHMACADCASNAYAVRIIDDIEQRLQWYLSFAPDLRPASTLVDHDEIFRAIEVRDEAAASAAMAEHLRSVRGIAMERLRKRQ